MTLQHIKMVIAAIWALAALAIVIAVDIPASGRMAILTLGFVPPLALLLWWNEPAETMSESIRDARR